MGRRLVDDAIGVLSLQQVACPAGCLKAEFAAAVLGHGSEVSAALTPR